MRTHYRVKIVYDSTPMNPREDFDHPDTMVCWHRRYNLGDKADIKREDAEATLLAMIYEYNKGFENELEEAGLSSEARQATIQDEAEKYYVILPLYLYDHSGITMSTAPFSCRWDSGCVGFIFISHADAAKNVGGPAFTATEEWTPEKQKAVEDMLRSQVQEYDNFLTGSVYGRVIEKFERHFEQPADEELDEDSDVEWEDDGSCYGFFGDHKTSGLLEDVPAALRPALEKASHDIDKWVYLFVDSSANQPQEV